MRTRTLALTGALVLVIAGCSSAPSSPSEDRPTAGSAPKPVPSKSYTLAPKPTVSLAPGAPMPTKVPASPGLVTFSHGGALVHEIDRGRSRICVGPQNRDEPYGVAAVCRGIDLIGFDWTDFPEARTGYGGLHYGSFDVVGRYDGKNLIVESADVHHYARARARSHSKRRTPCAPPVGGWRIVDPDVKHGTGADVSRVAYTARGLPGYAGFWLVHLGRTADNRVRIVLNVAVTRDKAGAERTLRKSWGGALCVSSAKHSVAALNAIANKVVHLPGVTGARGDFDRVLVDVNYDDGSLQAWVDQKYGKSLVIVRSALKPLPEVT
jgi:hypothetical protein